MPDRYLQVRREKLRAQMEVPCRQVKHSVRSLAAQVGTTHGTIGHLLTGEVRSVKEEMAERIAAELGAEMRDLFFLPELSTSVDVDEEVSEGGPAQ